MARPKTQSYIMVIYSQFEDLPKIALIPRTEVSEELMAILDSMQGKIINAHVLTDDQIETSEALFRRLSGEYGEPHHPYDCIAHRNLHMDKMGQLAETAQTMPVKIEKIISFGFAP